MFREAIIKVFYDKTLFFVGKNQKKLTAVCAPVWDIAGRKVIPVIVLVIFFCICEFFIGWLTIGLMLAKGFWATALHFQKSNNGSVWFNAMSSQIHNWTTTQFLAGTFQAGPVINSPTFLHKHFEISLGLMIRLNIVLKCSGQPKFSKTQSQNILGLKTLNLSGEGAG